jgi:hypothetical protein
MHVAHLFVLLSVLELVVAAAIATKFSQCNVLWGSFPQAGVQSVEGLILVDALFLLDVRRRREGKKKEKRKKNETNCCGEEGFPRV